MVRRYSVGLLCVACVSCAGLVAAALASTACITAPPPDLPQQVVHRPTILHDAVSPPPDEILAELPMEFIVPVEIDSPDESFQWDVFVDFDQVVAPNPVLYPTTVLPSAATIDGGVALQDFALTASNLDPTRCHRIDFLVAHAFDSTSAHTWDSFGGDIVSWVYNPGSNQAGCPLYDAGSLEDGAFPPPDAPVDVLPVVPDSDVPDSGADP
jgi:hypothetical protein